MGILRDLFGGPPVPPSFAPAKVEPEDRLFIGNREHFIGVIRKAEIRNSKVNGKPYIWLEISYDGIDYVGATLSRLGYTNYVIKEGLSTDYDAQEFNIARMVGGKAKIRFDHKMWPDRDRCYPTAIILEILP